MTIYSAWSPESCRAMMKARNDPSSDFIENRRVKVHLGHISELLHPPDQETREYTLLEKDKYLIDTATAIPGTTAKWAY